MFINNCDNKKLMLITSIFRHGARYPQYSLSGDGSEITRTWKSEGQLTTQGKNMHYVLGKILRQKYWLELFKDTPFQNKYNQSKFYVKSTDYNRTIQSAQSHLMGWLQKLQPLTLKSNSYLFSQPPWKNQINQSIPDQWNVFGKQASVYHPIAVHVQKLGANLYDQGDYLYAAEQQNCPNQADWIRMNQKNELSLKIQQNEYVKQALAALQAQVKTKVQFWSFYRYYSNYYSLKYLQLPYLSIFEKPQLKDTFCKFLTIVDFMFISTMYLKKLYTIDQKKASTSGLFNQILTRMKNIIKDPNDVQVGLYFDHDTSIAGILTALNITNANCIYQQFVNFKQQQSNKSFERIRSNKCNTIDPGYASNFIFELWKEDNETYTVKALYNGQELSLPICNNKLECSFTSFQSWVDQFKTNNVRALCGLISTQKKYYVIIGILFAIIAFAIGYLVYLRLEVNKLEEQKKIQLNKLVGHQVQIPMD